MLFPSDPVFPESEARRFLDPIEARLRKCVRDGFDAHLAACRAVTIFGPAIDYLGTRPHVINALVVEFIRREFSEEANGLRLTDEKGFMELQVSIAGDPVRVDLRFKLVDEEGCSSNTKTLAQWLYRNVMPRLGSV